MVEMYDKFSDNFQDCDNYQLTSMVESTESDIDGDDVSRRKRRRFKKNLPDDFVSSEYFDGKQV